MKYILLFCGNEDRWDTMPEAERNAMYGRIGEWWGRHSESGKIFGGEELQPATTATTVRHQEDRTVVTDGPFIEAKETVGGFALVDVGDLDEAIELAKTWPARGVVEIRPLVAESDHM
jgi:hypothetical protein